MIDRRKLSAFIRNRAKVVYAWIWLTDTEGVYIQISKSEGYQYCQAAKEDGFKDVLAYIKGREVFLGDDEEEHEATGEGEAAEGAEEEEEDVAEEGEEEEEVDEEEEEEDLGEEEEEEEEEEEAPVAKAPTKKAK